MLDIRIREEQCLEKPVFIAEEGGCDVEVVGGCWGETEGLVCYWNLL